MDRDLIFQLIDRLECSSLTSLELKLGEDCLRLEKGGKGAVSTPGTTPAPVESASAAAPVQESSASGKVVTSPIVGTFYRSPSPGASPFVSVGSAVKPGDVLCIVEAMKLLNEIECEHAGTVAEILMEDGALVEFGQPIFVIA